MMLLKALIKQQMKSGNISLAKLAVRASLPLDRTRDIVDNMGKHKNIADLEKIMIALNLFTFDNEEVDKKIKRELKKLK